jgi:hypothetical protein
VKFERLHLDMFADQDEHRRKTLAAAANAIYPGGSVWPLERRLVLRPEEIAPIDRKVSGPWLTRRAHHH